MCEENFETAKVAFTTGGLAGQQRDTRARARNARTNARQEKCYGESRRETGDKYAELNQTTLLISLKSRISSNLNLRLTGLLSDSTNKMF